MFNQMSEYINLVFDLYIYLFSFLVGLPAESTSSANCWDPTAVVPDTMCRFFTDCSTKIRYECPPNSLFERNLKRCVPKQNVQCWW
jgi:hypothetical protein